MAAIGPTLPTFAVQQVVGYLGYTGRTPNAVSKAAHDPTRKWRVHRSSRGMIVGTFWSCRGGALGPLFDHLVGGGQQRFWMLRPSALAVLRLTTGLCRRAQKPKPSYRGHEGFVIVSPHAAKRRSPTHSTDFFNRCAWYLIPSYLISPTAVGAGVLA